MQTLFVALFLLVSFGETLIRGEQTNVRTKHLFVQRKGPLRGSSLPHRVIYLSEDGNGSAKHSFKDSTTSRRSKRSTREKRSTNRDPADTLHEFNDHHHMLMVQWSGKSSSDTVVVLSRDIRQTSRSTSYLYVSNNYGVSYRNQSHLLHFNKDGITKHALIEKFYTSPSNFNWYIFADTTNNVLLISKDDCKTLTSVSLSFKPSDITFHNSKDNGLLAYDDKTQKIYSSTDFGSTWTERAKNVTSYFWGIEDLDTDDVIYLQIDDGNGTSHIIRGHWDHKHYRVKAVIENVIDFEIQDVYLFATKKSNNGLDLYVGYHYHDVSKAEFPNALRTEDYVIADASEGQVFIAVNHNKNTSHLYISDVHGKKYTLSMERVLLYSPNLQKDSWLRRYMTEKFVDLYPVASMRGVYIASQLSYGEVGTRKIYTVISYDKGRFWRNVNVPVRHANGSLVACALSSSCSLHLAQRFAQTHPQYYAPPVMSRTSAPGLIISSGNIGKRLSLRSNVYVSNDAGESWLEVLQGRWFYNFGDHGGVIVAARQWSATKEFLYSTDEGLTWKRYNFTTKPIHVYGLLTEPGETTTIFTIFGSYRGHHSWLVIQVNVSNVLGRPCTDADYETWSPHHRGWGYGCILGQRLEYERRKRNATCFNGGDYERLINTSICYCSDQDYECDAGFKPWSRWHFCLMDDNAGFDPLAPPRPCRPGTTYNETQGYRKIAGDKCSGGGLTWWYDPIKTSCPFDLDKAFLMYAERSTIQYVDLTNNNHSTQIRGLRGAVAVAYDMKDDYIYWADIKDQAIMRRKFNGSATDIITIAAVKQVEGLDFDWTTDNLYWVDSSRQVIEVCRKDGLFRKTLHADGLDRPRALALDPAMGEMFWSDWGKNPKIEKSDMDGKNRVVLIKSGIKWPNGLAIDIYNPKLRKLYYTDASIDIIGSYDLHTGVNKILASKTDHSHAYWGAILKHPYSIAVDDINVYWDDWKSGHVYKIHKSFKGKPETLIEKTAGLTEKSRYEIKVYYSRSQIDNSSCSGNTCSQLCLPKQNNTYVCACGDDLELDPKTGQCKCLGGLITLKNGTCIRQAGKSCTADEFPCRNGRCIPFVLKCDDYNDCGDYSDEDTGCDGRKGCGANNFHCPTGECIPLIYVCNGEKDCKDGYDEKPCKNRTQCPPDEFRCNDGQCVINDARCDGDIDCKDHSDEHKCPGHAECHNKDDFYCLDFSMCIPGSSRCNGSANCPDGSDEANCVTHCRNVDQWFMCYDKSACINKTLKCDGVSDCFDRSDEECQLTHCRNGDQWFMCRDRSACINITLKCDGKKDCVYDGSDEECAHVAGKPTSEDSKKTLIWAIPVGIVFAVLLGALAYFVVKSRRLKRSFYHLVRSDSFDHGVTYHNVGDDDDTPLIQGFSDDDPLVEA